MSFGCTGSFDSSLQASLSLDRICRTFECGGTSGLNPSAVFRGSRCRAGMELGLRNHIWHVFLGLAGPSVVRKQHSPENVHYPETGCIMAVFRWVVTDACCVTPALQVCEWHHFWPKVYL